MSSFSSRNCFLSSSLRSLSLMSIARASHMRANSRSATSRATLLLLVICWSPVLHQQLLLGHFARALQRDRCRRRLGAHLELINKRSPGLVCHSGCKRDRDRYEVVAVLDLLQELLIGAVVVDLNDNATKRPGFARLHDARGSVAVALNLDGEAAKVPRCIRICGNGEQATADRNRLDGSANCSHW